MYKYLLLSFSFFTGCSQPVPYEEGIANCKLIFREKMDENADKVRKGIPTKGVRNNRECLVSLSLPDFDIKTVSSTFNINEFKGKKSIICF